MTHLVVDGNPMATGHDTYLTATQFANATLNVDVGTDYFIARAYDGQAWSSWNVLTVNSTS